MDNSPKNLTRNIDFFSLKKISTKLRVDIYGWAKIQTFTPNWSDSGTVPLTIDIHHLLKLQRYFSTVPPSEQEWHKAFLRWVRAQGCRPDSPGSSKKCLGPYRHSPEKGCLRCQAINLNLPRRVKAWLDCPLRLELCPMTTHPTRSVLLTSRPAEVCPINLIQLTDISSETETPSDQQKYFRLKLISDEHMEKNEHGDFYEMIKLQ